METMILVLLAVATVLLAAVILMFRTLNQRLDDFIISLGRIDRSWKMETLELSARIHAGREKD